MARTSSAPVGPDPWLIAWSRSEVASRAEPSAARAISASAASSICPPSASAMRRSMATMSSGSMRRRSNRWQRDNTVTGTLRISVVAKMNFTWRGGSSRVLRSALNAEALSMCTSSMM